MNKKVLLSVLLGVFCFHSIQSAEEAEEPSQEITFTNKTGIFQIV